MGRSKAAAALLAGQLACSAPAGSATWIEQAESDLTCSGLADPGERQSLAAPGLPAPLDARSVTAYFRAAPRDERHARYRHLTALAAVGWWADQVNDQALRTEAYLEVGALADRYAKATGDAAFRQAARCARAHLIDASLEREQFARVDALAQSLAGLYPVQPAPASVEDWPLLLALRSVSIEPRARDAIGLLAARATTMAGATMRANQVERSSRLLAAASRGLLTLGDAARAQQLALQSLTVTGKPPAPAAAWRAMPVLYDVATTRNGAADAASLQAMLRPDQPPAALNDQQAAFESLLRLSMAAETKEQYDDMGRLAGQAFAMLGRMRGLERFPMPFYRHALAELAATRSRDLGTLAQTDAAFGARTLATYTGLYDTLLRQAQDQFIGDAREQAFFQYKIDNNLHAQTELYAAMPRSQAEIADSTFRLAQLRSFGRLTLATLSAELDRSGVDPAARGQVERFFMMTTQSGDFLRNRLESIRIAPGAAPPDGEALWKVFFPLDVYHEETAKQYAQYVAFVRQKAPGVTELATPRPLPVREFQRRLKGDEALVATLVTPLDLYVWAITGSSVTLTRHAIADAEIADKVRRLRAGLTPRVNGLPEFDAAVAHELYRLIFAPSAAALEGATTVVWYGHGPLGSIPPAVLVTASPSAARLRTPAEFGATRFLVERHAFTALADLSLFAWHRDRPGVLDPGPRFLGVGAPMLTPEELAGSSRSRSYELAGTDGAGLALGDLAKLPRLAESADEMRSLAAIAGEANSTLWLGPEASERRFVDKGLQGFGTIALATHGFLPGEVRNVPEPALMLALDPASRDRFDGILTSREIAGLTLEADLVVLSACNTASADGRPRAETFTGLTQAFFSAGARSMMVSHWPVMSGAAVQLSVGTIERWRRERLPLSSSLQQAMQAARKDGASSAVEAHPAYWGPFVIVGDGR
jgi:CHAT domain-containing protein